MNRWLTIEKTSVQTTMDNNVPTTIDHKLLALNLSYILDLGTLALCVLEEARKRGSNKHV